MESPEAEHSPSIDVNSAAAVAAVAAAAAVDFEPLSWPPYSALLGGGAVVLGDLRALIGG